MKLQVRVETEKKIEVKKRIVASIPVQDNHSLAHYNQEWFLVLEEHDGEWELWSVKLRHVAHGDYDPTWSEEYCCTRELVGKRAIDAFRGRVSPANMTEAEVDSAFLKKQITASRKSAGCL